MNETIHRDSGTSSPIHAENGTDSMPSSRSIKIITRSESQLTSFTIHPKDLTKENSFERHRAHSDETEEELSDSNDSVFSSGSSIDSILNGHDHNGDEPETFDVRDIYLGGSCALRSTWHNDVTEMLNEHDITYHMTQLHDSLRAPEDLDDRLSASPPSSHNEQPCTSKSLEPSSSNDSGIGSGLPRHSYRTTNGTVIYATARRMFNMSLLESSRVLLFFITNETRSLAPMTLAAHCIGLGYNVVMCVQMMSEGTSIGDEKVQRWQNQFDCFFLKTTKKTKHWTTISIFYFQLTPAAVKDYNRGRCYLIDLARRQEVPVFNDLRQATECAIEKVKQLNCRTST